MISPRSSQCTGTENNPNQAEIFPLAAPELSQKWAKTVQFVHSLATMLELLFILSFVLNVNVRPTF